MSSHGDYIGSEQYSVEELRAAVFGNNPNLAPALALALLAHKDYAERDDDMQRLLLAEDTPPRLRLTAAQTLGSTDNEKSRQTLLSALNTRDPVVLRGVVTALGRAGGEGVVGRLRGVQGGLSRNARTQIARAAYLLDLDGFDLPPLSDTPLLPVDGSDFQPILSEPASGEVVRRAIDDLQKARLPIDLEPESGLRLQCFDRDLLLLLNRAVGGASAAEVMRRRSYAGVVALLEDVEGENYTPHYHILTQPGKQGVQISLVTDSGLTALAGNGALRAGEIAFALRAVDQPGAQAAIIEGVFADGRVRLTNAASSLQRQPSRALRQR